ncbi:MAG: hypothetical protein NTX22_09305 [Ignavibacteriales bacterium]|nr:hypothetical protein [Ignavibacteriales bacterium]
MKKLLFLFFISLLFLPSCKKDETPVSNQDTNLKFMGTWIGNNKPAPHAVDSYTFIFTEDRYSKSWVNQAGAITEKGNYTTTETQLTFKPDGESHQGWMVVDYTINDTNLTIQNWEGDGYPLILKKQGTIELPLSAPLLISPADSAINVFLTPTLNWAASSGAISYTVQVSSSSSFISFNYNQSELTGTNQQVTGLSNNTKYFWRVNAANNFGTSAWAEVWSFTVQAGGKTGEPCPGIPTVAYAEKTYHTIQINEQCWLKENLDVGTKILGYQNASNNGTIEKYCPENDPSNCAMYGGLYQWSEAMAYDTTPGTKGICPDSWHIPTLAEFQTLATAVGDDGNKLKAAGEGTGIGVGTNTSGFSGLLAGSRYNNGYFGYLGYYASYWCSTDFDSTHAFSLVLFYDYNDITLSIFNKVYGFSVRCIKD